MYATRLAIAGALWFALGSAAVAQSTAVPYFDKSLSIEQRIDDLLPRLTIEEKISGRAISRSPLAAGSVTSGSTAIINSRKTATLP